MFREQFLYKGHRSYVKQGVFVQKNGHFICFAFYGHQTQYNFL